MVGVKLKPFFILLCIPMMMNNGQRSANISSIRTPCNLPPDFWCDHPETALACTGSFVYCDRYRSNRYGQPISLDLAFETFCPDSQQSIVQRLYPKIFSQPDIASMVNFKAIPWGLARREKDEVHCHHGSRECVGNRVLRCALLYFQADIKHRNLILNCFMRKMMYRPADPTVPMNQCLDELKTSQATKSAIMGCNKGSQATQLQRIDEEDTKRIGPLRFVPYIGINGQGHMHMQAYQMILAEKIRAWNKTLTLIVPRSVAPSACRSPPDFWCSDPRITTECYTQSGCAEYLRQIWNKPIHLKVIYNSLLTQSRYYVTEYLKSLFLKKNSLWGIENGGKVVLELEPSAALAPNIAANMNCVREVSCLRRAYEECIVSKIVNLNERVNQLVCLLSATNAQNLTLQTVTNAWETTCSTAASKALVSNCVSKQEWRHSFTRLATSQRGLRPQPQQWDPWVVLNRHSLSTVQAFNRHLHRMICIWYRGSGHDRKFCARCEYEPTHC